MVQPEDREDGAAVDIILKGKRQMKRKYGVVDYLRKHYPPPEGSGEVEVEDVYKRQYMRRAQLRRISSGKIITLLQTEKGT